MQQAVRGSVPESGGETLAAYLGRVGRLPVLQGLAFAVQLIAAVESLHRWGLVHGSIAPDALLVTRTGRLLMPGPAGGPPVTLRRGSPYVAPEQDLGGRADARCDLYSAAVVSYELLTGALPFGSTGADDIWLGRRSDAPRSVRTVRPDLPSELDAVFRRALARRADVRYQTAADLTAALQQAVPGPWSPKPALTPEAAVRAPAPLRVVPPVPVPVPVQIPVTAAPTPARPSPILDPDRMVHPGFSLAFGFSALALLGAFVAGRASHVPPTLHVPPSMQAAASGLVPMLDAPAQRLLVPAAPTSPASGYEEIIESPRSPSVLEEQPAAVRTPPRPHHRQAQLHAASSPSKGPDAACRHDFSVAPQLCTVVRCATAEFRLHPLCARLHTEGTRARLAMAEARGGP